MPLFNRQDEHFWRDISTHAILIIVCTALIVWLLPSKQARIFNYETGKPWMGEMLIAEFEFDVLKSEEDINQEKAKQRREYQPFFTLDTSVEREMAVTVVDSLSKLSDNFAHTEVRQLIRNKIHDVYQKGVISQDDYDKLLRDSNEFVRIINDKGFTTKSIDKVLSADAATDSIRHLLQSAREGLSFTVPYLNVELEPNLIYEKEINEEGLAEAENVPTLERKVSLGEQIIDRGIKVTEEKARAINAYKDALTKNDSSQSPWKPLIGQSIYIMLLLVLFTIYLYLFKREYFSKLRNILMLYVVIVLFPVLTSLMMRYMVLSVYILPYAMVAIIVSVFMDSRTAFVTHTTMVLICDLAVNRQEEFIILQLTAGMAAIYALRDLSKRSDMFKAAFMAVLCLFIMHFALSLMHDKFLLPATRGPYMHFVVSGILMLLASPLMFVVEKAFGFTSSITLLELSDTNKSLLRRLSQVAPGTFQHSITVGNLAAEIAKKLKADSQLVRTGALYHDIGKMANPVFFTENQANVNPHEKLSEKESASIIINHVSEGLRLAEQEDLPDKIKNFITTHHGSGLVKFFYVKYKNAHPDEEIDEEAFTYPGPNPFTREQAILMMADTVEAASRSLNEYTEESLSELINRLIDNQVKAGFFTECPITFQDIANAKQVLLDNLKSIYHTRIKYPELKKE